MPEIELTGANALTFPTLTTWGWEIAAYLFLGGLVAGLLVFAGVIRLANAPRFERALRVSDLAGLPLLGVGMFLLFLDLSNKSNVWRFYTTFQVTSVISWGAWILLATMVVLVLRFVARVHVALERDWRLEIGETKRKSAIAKLKSAIRSFLFAIVRFVVWTWNVAVSIGAWAKRHDRALALAGVVLGIGVGFYTGVFLSTLAARPLWNSAVLAPLFLISGLASGGAFLCLLISEDEHKRLVPFSLMMCGVELVLLLAYAINLVFGTDAAQRAGSILLGGAFGIVFWGLVVLLGLLVPATVEGLELLHRRVPLIPARMPPILKLSGSLALRFAIVYAGLLSFV